MVPAGIKAKRLSSVNYITKTVNHHHHHHHHHQLSKLELSNTFCLKKEKSYHIETLSIDRVLESHAENLHQKLVPGPFFVLRNNPKQPLLSFKNKIF